MSLENRTESEREKEQLERELNAELVGVMREYLKKGLTGEEIKLCLGDTIAHIDKGEYMANLEQ